MRNLVSLLGVAALAACTTNNNTTVSDKPEANGVFPASGFAGRELRVEISGNATTFDSATTVSFGTGITVKSVTVASPTDLFADITIDPGAMPGKSDVNIMDAKDGMLTLTGAFEIQTPAKVSYAGQLVSGSLGTFTIENLDTEHPFDDTTDATGAFANVAINGAPTGTTFTITAVQPFKLTGSIALDVDAASGAPTVTQTLADGTTITSNMDMLQVTTRTATALVPGTAATGTLANAGDTALFSITPTTPDVDHWTITSTADAGMTFFVLPQGKWANAYLTLGFFGFQTGQFADLLETSVQAVPVFILPVSTVPAADFSLLDKELALTNAQTAVTTNTTSAAATAVTSPAVVTGAALTSTTDQHWYKITVAAGQVTAQDSIHVMIEPLHPEIRLACTQVQIFGPNNATTSFAGPSAFTATPNGDLNSPKVVAAGTYFIEVTWDSATCGTDFNASVGGGQTVGSFFGAYSISAFFDSTVTPF